MVSEVDTCGLFKGKRREGIEGGDVPDRHIFESQIVAEVGPGDHHDGLLWQFSIIIGFPVAFIRAAHKDIFIAEPH